jgi:hypothetical protein
MTISSTTVKNSYNGDGSTATFTYTFKIFADSDLQVIIRSALGTETVKTLTTHYTVTGAGSASGGDITFTAGNIPASGETVVLRRAIPQTQAIDYIANDPFPAESHEEGLDRATMAIQQLQEEVDRSIKLSRTNTITSSEFTVGAANRANKVLAFDASGELSVAQELGQFQGNWSAGETFAQRDLVKDTSNNNIYICLTAHTSSGSLPISSNADVAKWSLIVDAASATTSASAAAASASAAATSESNAATSASNASSSASSAASSLSSTQTIFDNFDDRFLGTKTSDPTLDNDGDALLTGAIYYNSSTNELKVYNGTTWDAPTTQASNSATSAASSASTATTQAGIATTQAGNASTSASNAATSETNAATSASTATTQAGIATTQATNASNSASAAATSASNASTSATNASNSASAAATSASNAAASYDSFDDRYLGPKASDPSTDNDGDALIDGALYFNTTGNVLKYWDGAAWNNVEATDTSSFATNGFAIAMAIAL